LRAQAISVPDAVREILANNHTYSQALELGIANYTALAEKIKQDIENMMGATVSLNTIVVAIKRFADNLEERKKSLQQQQNHTSLLGQRPRMSLTNNIIDIDFQKDLDDDNILENMLDQFFENDSQYNLFQTDNHFTLLIEDANSIRAIVDQAIEKFDGKIREGLCKVTISLKEEEESPYRLLSLISNILYNYQIPIRSAFFNSKEIVLALYEADAAKAYDLIRKTLE
jgi:hypothetical protein